MVRQCVRVKGLMENQKYSGDEDYAAKMDIILPVQSFYYNPFE
jgi:hypothetical protein